MKIIEYIILYLVPGSGTVTNYGSGSGSGFLTSYGSGSTSQKVTVPYGSGSTTLVSDRFFLPRPGCHFGYSDIPAWDVKIANLFLTV
jgi:hypothetical protein